MFICWLSLRMTMAKLQQEPGTTFRSHGYVGPGAWSIFDFRRHFRLAGGWVEFRASWTWLSRSVCWCCGLEAAKFTSLCQAGLQVGPLWYPDSERMDVHLRNNLTQVWWTKDWLSMTVCFEQVFESTVREVIGFTFCSSSWLVVAFKARFRTHF